MRHSSSYRIARAATLPEASTTIADHPPANSAAITRALFPVGAPDLLASTLLGVGAPPPLVTAVAASDDGRYPHPPTTTSSADSQCVVTRTFGEWAHAPLEPVARIPRRAGARRAVHLVGVLTLTALALVLVGYCATAAFYYTSDSWIVPIVLSPHDEQVVALQAELAQRTGERERLAVERAEIDRAIAEHGAAPARPTPLADAHDSLAFAHQRAEQLATAIARTDDSIAALRQTPQLRALADRMPIAVVPYGALARMSPGTGVYACRLAMLFCRRVGSVLELLPGEVTLEHPHRRSLIRGRLVELALDEPPAAALDTDVLFVGGAPLWL